MNKESGVQTGLHLPAMALSPIPLTPYPNQKELGVGPVWKFLLPSPPVLSPVYLHA